MTALLQNAVIAEEPLVNSIGMKFVFVPSGEFLMGSSSDDLKTVAMIEAEFADERQNYLDESPQHRVRITRPFYLGAHEVTQEQYQRVIGKNPSGYGPDGVYAALIEGIDTRRYPVESVSWNKSQAFCEQLSALPEEKAAGRSYGLPTEAQWEYACRAGTSTAFSVGTKLSSDQANFNGLHPFGVEAPQERLFYRPAPVGSYPPNAWGLYDMHGNVFEWCADSYDAKYYEVSPADDPTGPVSNRAEHVVRGGSWRTRAGICRSACRAGDDSPADAGQGFRVVLRTERPR